MYVYSFLVDITKSKSRYPPHCRQRRDTLASSEWRRSSAMAKRLRTDPHASDPSQLQLSEQPDNMLPPPAKVTVSDESQSQSQPQLMRCSLPPHRDTITFSSYDEYEVHYLKNHVNRCSECGKNFPTQHILDVHIEENHDPLILARRDRGEKTVGYLSLYTST